MTRDLMTDEEAILILELGTTFTNEELKSAYIKITKKYHPDKWAKESKDKIDKANEKMQKANLAYNYLKRKYFLHSNNNKVNLNVRFYEQNKKVNQIDELKNKLKKETKKYENYLGYSEVKELIDKKIDDIISSIGHKYNNEELINLQIKKLHEEIINIFKNYFKDVLTRKTKQYEEYNNEFIKIRILNKINAYVIYAEEKEFNESIIDELINNFDNEIKGIISKSFILNKECKSIMQIFESNSAALIIVEFKDIYEKFNSLLDDYHVKGIDISNELSILNSELSLLLNDNNFDIKIVYNSLINKYQKQLLLLQQDYNRGIDLAYIFASVMYVFSKIKNDEIDKEKVLELLSRISFENYQNDKELLDEINVISKSGIYIRNPKLMNNTFYDQSIFYLIKENNNYVMYSTGVTTRKDIVSIEQINNEFIPFEDFLNNSEFVNKTFKTLTGKMLVLYSFNNISLVKGDKDFIISLNIKANLKDNFKNNNYQDKKELINLIKKQVLCKIEDFEKRNNKRLVIK